VSEHTFEDIYKSVQNLEAGSFVTFNGFPMVVETQTTTYNRYYGELRWVNQLDGKLQIDVTLRAVIKFDSEVTRLKAEVERLKNTDPQSITDVDIKANPEWAMACFQFHRENERAEIARLRKAGDNLERVLTSKVASYEVANASYEWQAAKKGEKSV
jgi:hypothetical protein